MHINKESALNLLQRAVNERGADFRYSDRYSRLDGCTYVQNGAPACIVGVGLFELGIGVDALDQLSYIVYESAGYEFHAYDSLTTSDSIAFIPLTKSKAFNEFDNIDISLDENAVRILTAAQLKQDDDAPWGVALEFAREVANELE